MSGAPPGGRRGLAALLGVLAVLSLAYGAWGALVEDAAAQGGLLWDLGYYRDAAARWSAGLDPYQTDGSHTGYYYSLVLTPLISEVFLEFAAERLYAALVALAVLATLALALRAVAPAVAGSPLVWLYALAFGNADSVYVVASGNLGWLVGLLQAGGLLAASRGAWTSFYVLIGIAALFKPYSLLLLAVPFALGALTPRALLALAPPALNALLAAALWPGLAASRTAAIWSGVIEPLQLRYSLAGRLSRVLVDLGADVPMATLLAVAAQLSVALAFLLALRWGSGSGDRQAFALALVAAFVALPRMAGYDAYVFGPAVLAAFLPVARSAPRGAAMAAGVALVAGLFKEGLALLPPLALAALLLAAPPWRTGEA